MNRSNITFSSFLCISLCAMLVLLAGCAGKDKADSSAEWITQMRSKVSIVVEDPDRAEQIIGVFSGVEADLQKWGAYKGEYFMEMEALNADYDATPEEFRDLIGSYNVERSQIKRKMLDARLKIKGLSTRDEWQVLTTLDKTLFQQVLGESSH